MPVGLKQSCQKISFGLWICLVIRPERGCQVGGIHRKHPHVGWGAFFQGKSFLGILVSHKPHEGFANPRGRINQQPSSHVVLHGLNTGTENIVDNCSKLSKRSEPKRRTNGLQADCGVKNATDNLQPCEQYHKIGQWPVGGKKTARE